MNFFRPSRPNTKSYTLPADEPPRSWTYVIIIVSAAMVSFLLWASWAEVDQISRAEGRVIPSGKTQIIQSAEQGVVSEILVRSGEQVSAGQLLVRLDDTNTASSAGEVEARVLALLSQVERLRVESTGGTIADYACPPTVQTQAPAVCAAEIDLLTSRLASLSSSTLVLAQRVEQRQRELNEVTVNKARMQGNLDITRERLALIEPMAARGLAARTDLLALQAEVGDLAGQIEAANEGMARLESAVQEARLQMEQAELQFRQEGLSDLTLRSAELASAQQQLRGATDRVARTDVRSPVDGIVNSIDVTTIGAVVTAGARLLDIVPKSDFLLVEAKLRPADVAFVIPGQAARIALSAYDFSIYGGIEGKVENVSADSIVDQNTRETYYLVTIRAESTALNYRGQELAVLPGMVTTVDILTGRHSILNYLLKPINKVRQEALIER